MTAGISETYIAASTAQKTKQYDMYKRFIRWASDRLADDGIIAFITNRGYLDSRQDDGFRQLAAREFSDIYVLDLGSDVRRNPKISGTTHNVFGIQTGVAIGFFVRDKSKFGECGIHYAKREDAELATDKLGYLGVAKLDEMIFAEIAPDEKHNWLNQSNPEFAKLMPLADRQTKLAKKADDERAVFGLYSLGIISARDEWIFDPDVRTLSEKVKFFCKVYQDESRRLAVDKPTNEVIGDWVNRSIKWTSELESYLVTGTPLEFSQANIVTTLFRPFVSRYCYYAPIITHRRYQQPHIFPHHAQAQNRVICFCVNGKGFYTLVSDGLVDYHFTGDTQCLPLYRYTDTGERVSNITGWGLQRINEHYRKEWGEGFGAVYPDGITAEDIFAYTYAVLHDPVYHHDYEVDLTREFPRLPLYRDFDVWARMGQELLDLHVGFESAEQYPLVRNEQSGDATKPILRAEKERGAIVLDDKTSLTGVPKAAWRYRLGNRSALEWVLDQYKEKKPRDPTIAEKFNTYRFADYKERVIDLLQRVCTVSVRTMDVVDDMAYWEGDRLVVFGDRDKGEWSMAGLAQLHNRPEDEDWLAAWSET